MTVSNQRFATEALRSEWTPERGDLVLDTVCGRIGVVVALPEDSNTDLYHLRPPDGGEDWVAGLNNLEPRPDSTKTSATGAPTPFSVRFPLCRWRAFVRLSLQVT